MKDTPIWIPSAKSASIRKWTEQLHEEAKRVFLQDKTHAHLLFLFNDAAGLISINPIPPKTDNDIVNESMQRAVKEHELYGIILIAEAWVYFPKENDHTAFQLMDGEMKVSDLNDEDKTEVLVVRMESRDGDCLLYLDKIIRNGEQVDLGAGRQINPASRDWFV